jgi:hypothetical protein
MRAPASLGVADVVALKAGERPRLIESKSTTRSPWSGFPPADRRALSEAAKRAGADALLCWWPKRSEPRFIPEREWPPQPDTLTLSCHDLPPDTD